MPITGYLHATARLCHQSGGSLQNITHQKSGRKKQTNGTKSFNIDFILRVGIVYNNSKYFAGTSFIAEHTIITGTISR